MSEGSVQLLLPLANSDTNCDSHGEVVVRRIPYLILRGHASLFPIFGNALAPLSQRNLEALKEWAASKFKDQPT
jgi:hypothetical protein